MAERDLIEQLDAAVEAMRSGRVPEGGPEVTALARIAAWAGDLPDAKFRAGLKAELRSRAAAFHQAKEKEKMATAASFIPKDFHTLTPYLLPASAAGLIDFLTQTFGAVELARHPTPEGRVMHAEVRIGDSMLEMGEPPQPQQRAMALRIFVPDVDSVYERALKAGGTSIYGPVDQPYGFREAGIKDPAGNDWFVSRRIGPQYKAEGLNDLEMCVFAKGAAGYLDFLGQAFGAETTERHTDAEGTVRHASAKIGDSVIGIGEAHGEWQPMPGAIHYYLPDVDAAYRRALAAGATSLSEPVDQAYGERSAGVVDPQGNHWYLAARLAQS